MVCHFYCQNSTSHWLPRSDILYCKTFPINLFLPPDPVYLAAFTLDLNKILKFITSLDYENYVAELHLYLSYTVKLHQVIFS